MDGSEEGETTPAAVLSGAPVELQARTVRYGRGIKFLLRGADQTSESTSPPKPQRNQAHGMVINGEWTGTYWAKAIGGKIH